MSQHYEVVFSMFLRDDTPQEILDELRWRLGESSERPAACALSFRDRLLIPGADYSDIFLFLPGTEVTSPLRLQDRGTVIRWVAGQEQREQRYAWGLHVRLVWRDDQWADVWLRIAIWLSPYPRWLRRILARAGG